MVPTALKRSLLRLPVLLAVFAICSWPIFQPPCCCAASSADSVRCCTIPSADQPVTASSCCQSSTPACCQTSTADSQPSGIANPHDACDCVYQSNCDCEVRSELTDAWVSSRVDSSEDQTLVASVPIGMWVDSFSRMPDRRNTWHPAPAATLVASAKDQCAMLCRWLN